jgi:hypothetical protein
MNAATTATTAGATTATTAGATTATTAGATTATTATATPKKKRASKATKTTIESTESVASQEVPVATKGRKTRGSKIVTKQQIAATVTTPALTNIILNLKCSMNDLKEYNDKLSKMISNPLEYNSSAPPEVKYYDGEKAFGAFIRTDSEHVRFEDSENTEIENNGTGEDMHQSKSMTQFLSFSADETNHADSIRPGLNSSGSDTSNDLRNAVQMDAGLNLHGYKSNSSAANSLFGLNKPISMTENEMNHAFINSDSSQRVKNITSFANVDSISTRGTGIDIYSSSLTNGVDIKISKCELEDKMFNATEEHDDVNVKDMSVKLKQLKIQLYKNTLNSEKKSACFWCTYDFDNAPCYIPKYEMDGTIFGYGSFCRPECAVAYLMKETIDDSTKFDRYHLLNQIYSKVYECKKNIKPAPDPHYLLDKFYGNLTIQEYRRLLKTEHLLLVIDKPLTRILPELHEDTDDAFTKIYGIKATSGNSSGVYKVKRQSEQPLGPSKASIIKNTFGIST